MMDANKQLDTDKIEAAAIDIITAEFDTDADTFEEALATNIDRQLPERVAKNLLGDPDDEQIAAIRASLRQQLTISNKPLAHWLPEEEEETPPTGT